MAANSHYNKNNNTLQESKPSELINDSNEERDEALGHLRYDLNSFATLVQIRQFFLAFGEN